MFQLQVPLPPLLTPAARTAIFDRIAYRRTPNNVTFPHDHMDLIPNIHAGSYSISRHLITTRKESAGREGTSY
jgi:hypothetical protein